MMLPKKVRPKYYLKSCNSFDTIPLWVSISSPEMETGSLSDSKVSL